MEREYGRTRSARNVRGDGFLFVDTHEREGSLKGAPLCHGNAEQDHRGPDFEEPESLDEFESLSEEDSVRESKNTSSRAQEKMKWWKVYALHFLFMWNTRTYEYASIVLVSLAFPKTLFATSIRGITSTVSAMLCASTAGSWIDRAPSRLPPLLITISSNHGAIVASYLCWLIWPLMAGYQTDDSTHQTPFSKLSKGFLFGFILLLDVIHDLSAIGNRLSVERDWVPVLVGSATRDTTYGLTQINAVMRRIDLICKLVAPSLLPLIVANFSSRAAWIILLMVVTLFMWAVEVWCAQIIANDNPQLRLPKAPSNDAATMEDLDVDETYYNIKPGLTTWPQQLYFVFYRDPRVRIKHYFSMAVWPASISISILQMTVLAYSATLITYLLEVGFSLSAITIARASGSIMALSGTFITPMAVQYLRRRYSRSAAQSGNSKDIEGRVVRTVGQWGVTSQFICMIPVVTVLWNLSPMSTASSSTSSRDTTDDSKASIPPPHLLISIILFSFLSLTRIGHWMYDLMVQELEQVEIPSSQRSTFAGTEQSFRSFFELCHWGATIIWSQPEDFRWLALGSLIVLGVGTSIFAAWTRKEGRSEARYEEIALDDIG